MYAHSDHSFTLQAVMELHKSTGEMKAAIEGLTTVVGGVKTKVDDLISWKNMIVGGAAVLGVVFTLMGFAIGKFWDYITIKAPAAPVAIVAPHVPGPTSGQAPLPSPPASK
jgi:hypothetical protein